MNVMLLPSKLVELCTQRNKESFFSGRIVHAEPRKNAHSAITTSTRMDALSANTLRIYETAKAVKSQRGESNMHALTKPMQLASHR